MPTVAIYTDRDAQRQDSSGTLTVQNATGTTATFQYAAGAYGSYTRQEPILHCDLSSIPAASFVTSIVFNYVVDSVDTATFAQTFPRRLTSAWTEANGVTGPTDDGVNAATPCPFTISTGARTYSDTSFTTWVQNWISGAATNYGWVIYNAFPTNTGAMRTREQTGTTNDPYLSITYGRPPTVSNVGVPTGTSIPASGNVSVGFTYSSLDSSALDKVAIRRVRLSGT